MALTLTNAAASAACDAIVDLIDAGGAGTIEIYTAAKATLLGTLTFSATAFGAASNGVATAAAITGDTSADATGSAAIFVVKSGAGTQIFEGTITATGGGGDMTMPSISITAGQPIDIDTFTFTVPTS